MKKHTKDNSQTNGERDHTRFLDKGPRQEKASMKGYTGSPAHRNMEYHGGKVGGAGELSFGTGPGKAAMKKKPDMSGLPEGGANSYKAKGMKTYDQE